ncbi:MAG: DUF1957 domain-containing protein [Spirochaetes bacterium]|nr:DUF1957 domain-containing protein [Spirochaetota bacterium]
MANDGYLAIILNAHLPYIRHPELKTSVEESWLFEAVLDTYLPLLNVLEKLKKEGLPVTITLSVSPSLVEMLVDPLLNERFLRYTENKIKLTEKELERTKNNSELFKLASMYLKETKASYAEYKDRYKRNILNPLSDLEQSGLVEIITTSATHAFLPLLNVVEGAVRGQIHFAVQSHEKHFGVKPEGMWLPECGYSEGMEYILEENGINYFFLDSHGLLFGDRKPKYGVYAPVKCRNGVSVFGRDAASAKAVWSNSEGYPADPVYRDFYQDIGYNLPFEYLKPYLYVEHERGNTGIKYFSKHSGGERNIYKPEAARKKVLEHSENFIYRRLKQLNEISQYMDRPPLIVCPYDAELFGHWWYEGISWLENVLRKAAEGNGIKLISPSEYLKHYPENQIVAPSFSSWGNKGYSEVWLEKRNDWIYRHLHRITERMCKLAGRYPNAAGVKKRALNQAAREVLLAQSSDWAFMMKMGTDTAYALRRIKEHIYNFNKLYFSIIADRIEETWLAAVEYKNNIFSDIDYKVYSNSTFQ